MRVWGVFASNPSVWECVLGHLFAILASLLSHGHLLLVAHGASLGHPQVQAAIHANTSHLPYPWNECSDIVNYSRDDLLSSMLPVYRDLIAAGLKLLVFSGDVDAIVPVGLQNK
jgi:hypothetical protein